jgi:hypothetical protein
MPEGAEGKAHEQSASSGAWKLSGGYFLLEDPAKAVAKPSDMSMPPLTYR